MLPDRISRAVAGGKVGAALSLNEDPGYTRRVQRAQTMGSLLKSIVSGVVFTVVGADVHLRARLRHRAADRQRRASSAWRSASARRRLVKDFLSGIFMIFEDQYGVGDEVDLGEAVGHRRGGQPARHPAARRQRHGLVRPQRRDPAGGQHEPELGAHRARHPCRLRRGPRPRPARARRGRARPVGGRGLHGSRHRGALGVGRPGARRRRGRRARGAEDRAAGAVGRSRARCAQRIKARFDHEGIEMPVPAAGRVDARGRAALGRSTPGSTSSRPPTARRRRNDRREGGWFRDDHLLRRDRRRGDDPHASCTASTRASPSDEVLRPLYPEEDLGPAEERFALFLVQYWGGPTTYSDTRGHPRLRMRHAPFEVTPTAAQHWLVHFRAGPRRGRPDPRAGRPVLGLRHPRRPVHGQHARVTRSAGHGSPGSASRHRRRVVRSSRVDADDRPPGPGRAPASPSQHLRLEDRPTCVPTVRDPGPAVVRLGAEQDRAPVVDVGLRDHEVAAVAELAAAAATISWIRASWKYSKYFTLLTWP